MQNKKTMSGVVLLAAMALTSPVKFSAKDTLVSPDRRVASSVHRNPSSDTSADEQQIREAIQASFDLEFKKDSSEQRRLAERDLIGKYYDISGWLEVAQKRSASKLAKMTEQEQLRFIGAAGESFRMQVATLYGLAFWKRNDKVQSAMTIAKIAGEADALRAVLARTMEFKVTKIVPAECKDSRNYANCDQPRLKATIWIEPALSKEGDDDTTAYVTLRRDTSGRLRIEEIAAMDSYIARTVEDTLSSSGTTIGAVDKFFAKKGMSQEALEREGQEYLRLAQ